MNQILCLLFMITISITASASRIEGKIATCTLTDQVSDFAPSFVVQDKVKRNHTTTEYVDLNEDVLAAVNYKLVVDQNNDEFLKVSIDLETTDQFFMTESFNIHQNTIIEFDVNKMAKNPLIPVDFSIYCTIE